MLGNVRKFLSRKNFILPVFQNLPLFVFDASETMAKFQRRKRVFKRKRTVGKGRVRRAARRTTKRRASKYRRMRRARGSRLVMYNRLVQPKVRTILRYVDTKTLTGTSGTTKHSFLLNSLYDPDNTGGGHQPAFKDQWAALYGKYRVLGCSVTVIFRPYRDNDVQVYTGSTDAYPYVEREAHKEQHIMWMEASDSSSAVYCEAVDKNFLRETGRSQRHVKWRYGRSGAVKLSGRYNMRDLYADPESWDDSTAMTANPADFVFLHVGILSKDGSWTCNVRFDISMRFYVELSEPVQVGES